jgi:hypothetical protein
MSDKITAWETQLGSFDPEKRKQALHALIESWRAGQAPVAPPQQAVNLHCHTFFSYNGYGYSPSGVAWLAKKAGWEAAGIVDFDVLDGVEEFLQACELAGVRGVAGLETRVYIPEFAAREINSPGEPGIFYLMGIGFTASSAPGNAAQILSSMRQRAEERNRAMLAKLNGYLAPVTADYARDILPLTPKGNVTERHMLEAYDTIARRVFTERAALIAFWVEKLGAASVEIEKLVDNPHALRDLIRSKLMKRGGVGYMTPTPETFPRADEVNEMTIACSALPCATWLDGASAGEQAEEELLALLIKQDVAALNIIPDRNWNFPDEKIRQAKIANLYQVVKLAQSLDLPLIVGTEMNKYGQKRVDDFDSEALRPLRQAFLDGAYFIYGHTVLQRAAGLGYQSDWATKHLPARRKRNAFYAAVGKAAQPNKLPGISKILEPGDILTALTNGQQLR